jgi:mxaD protein
MHARFTVALALGLAASVAAASEPARAMLSVREKVELATPPAKTWGAIKDYDGLHKWHPAFAGDEIAKGKNNVKGAVRVLTLKDGGKITEELLAYSAKDMSMTYRITDSPLPLTEYAATIEVAAGKNGGSVITWSSTFKGKDAVPKEGTDDDGLKKMVSGLYISGFDSLKAMLAK